jgi:uncharacterized DUF497 family protein
MEIEFDSKKAELNPINHDGVTLQEGATALHDPHVLTKEDPDVKGEQRFISLGMSAKNRILVVVWTERGETIRLISAWKATKPRRREYEKQF